MEENAPNRKKRRTTAAIIAVCSIAVILFLCIFSLYHLPERDPVETPEVAENADVVTSPAEDFAETNDIMSASQEQVSEMLGNLEMQYQNARLNNEPYEAQQAGMRLALAYWKAGQTQQAVEFTDTLMKTYCFDQSFVSKCQDFLKTIDSTTNNN